MELEQASRPLMWNVEGIGTYIGLYGLFLIALAILLNGLYQRVMLWLAGKPSPVVNLDPALIIKNFFTWGALQKGVVKRRTAGIMHMMLYLGFLVLTFTTTMVFIHQDLGIKIYQGNFYLLLTVMSDAFGIAVLFGCGLAGYRRFISEEKKLHTTWADSLMLSFIALLVIQGFVLEGIRVKVTNDPWRTYSFIGELFAAFFWNLSDHSARNIHAFTWWFHAVTFFAALALTPYTKFFHIFSCIVNVSLRGRTIARGALPYPGNIEALLEEGAEDLKFGIETIKDYTWKQKLDLDACTSCGRCQDVCPAYNSGKPLSPKWLVLDTRNHMLATQPDENPSIWNRIDKYLLKDFFLSSIGFFKKDKTFRATNPLVQNAEREKIGMDINARIAGEVMSADVFNSCTTCFACVKACPVGIHHVDMIVENRRNMVLMQGEIHPEAQGTLRAVESKGTPIGEQSEREVWAKDLGVRILQPGDEVEYLYWVGCISSFDPRKQQIAKSLVKIMQKAGVSFGILGTAEKCTGDPARRLGEENLYQTMAKGNIEVLKTIRFENLVANCPHCFHTIKNEYPQIGNLGEGRTPKIIHHTQLIKKLLKEEKIHSTAFEDKSITFHDPCYLGRYNEEYDAPRDILKSSKLRVIEMEDNREKGMCCGAGGGHYWMDLKIGERINKKRTLQAINTGADTVATACPFCMQMMEDGAKLNNAEDSLRVRDIAEIVAEGLEN